MAEMLGIITGAITVVETAGQAGSSILKLKRLWDEVKDAPQKIKSLIDELERYKPLLDSLDAEFEQIEHIVSNNPAAKASTGYCRQAMSGLEALIQDFEKEVESKRNIKRGVAKVKVVLKKGVIEKYREQMQNALDVVKLAQQTYLMYGHSFLCSLSSILVEDEKLIPSKALLRLQPSLIAAQISSWTVTCSRTSTHEHNEPRKNSDSGIIFTKETKISRGKASSLPWRSKWQVSCYGGFALDWDFTDVRSDTSPQIKTQG